MSKVTFREAAQQQNSSLAGGPELLHTEMLHLDGSDIESQLLAWARSWCELLAEGRLDAACAELDEARTPNDRWTSAQLTARIESTFGAGTRYARLHPEGPRFTSARSAQGRERSHTGPFADGNGFWLDYDLPLNGKFSDLTARFEFTWHTPRVLSIALIDLHVL